MRKKKSEFKPITYLKRSVEFDGKRQLRCLNCGGNHIMCPPPYPEMPLEQMQWTTAFNSEIGNFFMQHERCKREG